VGCLPASGLSAPTAITVDRFEPGTDHAAGAHQKRLGIQAGGVVAAEERDKELVLRPAIVLEVDAYSDSDIGQWDEAALLAPGEHYRILKRLGGDR